MSRKNIAYFISFIFILLGVINFIIHLNINDKSDEYENQISKAVDVVKISVDRFLSETEITIKKINSDFEQTPFDSLSKERLDHFINPVFSSQNKVKGIVILSKNLNYIFLLDRDTRITTFSSGNDTLLDWVRVDKNLNPVSEWSDTYNFFLNDKTRTVLEEFLDSPEQKKWMEIKSEIADRERFTVFLNKVKTVDGKKLVAIYLFKTSDFYNFFLKEFKLKEPVLAFLTDRNNIITPVIDNDSAKSEYTDKIKVKIKEVFDTWVKKYNNDDPRSFSFIVGDEFYWLRINPLKTDVGLKAFALAISQEDLKNISTKVNDIFFYAGFLLVFAGIAIAVFSFLKKKKNKNKVPGKPNPLSEKEIKTLLKTGESGKVEYKSSLRYDYRQKTENKALEDVILKSIAAFANGRGGVLLIGVDDDGNVLGLKNDFSTLKKNDIDYFELHLRKLINNQFGIHFSDYYLRVQFPEIDGENIVVIQIDPSDKPVYVKVKNKQGQWVEKFYVRYGNSSQEISSLKELEEYIKHRFKNHLT